MAAELPEASLLENVRFNSQVIVPNALQGIFRRRQKAVMAATAADVDRWAVGLISGIRDSKGPGPVWVRVIKDRALLLLTAEDIRRALEGSPEPFAPDPEAKRKGMSHFQPDALTISRNGLWEKRRRFAEAVLDSGKPHRLGDRFSAVIAEETGRLLELAELDFDSLHPVFRRITRRVVLGDAARDDELLSERLAKLMDEANGLPSEPSDELEPFLEHVAGYVEAAEEGSLVGLVPEAPADDETKPARQVIHWLFAMQDTLAINVLRALALLATHPTQRARAEEDREYLEACLEEALRLWPTTPLLSRETLEDIDWNGVVVPAGTQVLISNLFMHRDKQEHDYADRFAPEEWIEGNAAEDWSFNHFSHGPQGCPGAGLSLFVGTEVLNRLLSERRLTLESPSLDPGKPLPHMLDFFRIKIALKPR